MSVGARRLAIALSRTCFWLMPKRRKMWASAMQAETNAITDPTEALCFAWGCILAAGRERILTMEFTRSATRVLLLLWLGGMSAGTAFAATKLWSVHEPTGMIYAALAATLSISLFWSSYRGAAALVQAASTILFVDVIAFILFRTEVAAGQGWVNLELYQQLTREGIFIWAFILAGSLFLNNSRKPEATHQAR